MTDNEIIKAFKLCVTNDYFEHNCKVCPFKPHGAVCTSVMSRCVFELINRQKADVEALRMDNQQLQSDIANANMNADHALAEIERLQHRISELEAELDDLKRDDLPRCKDALRRANEIGMAVDKENQELKAEIERLTSGKCVYLSDDETTEYCVEGPCSKYKTEAQAKAEAIKEFAERLKLHSYIISDESQTGIITRFSFVTANQIDNLVKEMAGE